MKKRTIFVGVGVASTDAKKGGESRVFSVALWTPERKWERNLVIPQEEEQRYWKKPLADYPKLLENPEPAEKVYVELNNWLKEFKGNLCAVGAGLEFYKLHADMIRNTGKCFFGTKVVDVASLIAGKNSLVKEEFVVSWKNPLDPLEKAQLAMKLSGDWRREQLRGEPKQGKTLKFGYPQFMPPPARRMTRAWNPAPLPTPPAARREEPAPTTEQIERLRDALRAREVGQAQNAFADAIRQQARQGVGQTFATFTDVRFVTTTAAGTEPIQEQDFRIPAVALNTLAGRAANG